jgi:C1A family cysteine protease
MQGYGWLPYEYVLRNLATDWWSLISATWVATKQFGI